MLDDPKHNARFDHLMLNSEDPSRLADFYRHVMDYAIEQLQDSTWLCEAQDRRIMVGQGVNRTLRFAAYSFSNPEALEALRQRLRLNDHELSNSPSPFFDKSAFAVNDPDGNTLVFGICNKTFNFDRQHIPARLQHLVVASDELGPMINFYTEVLGAVASDKVYDAEGNLTACFMRTDQEHHSFAVFRAQEKRLDHHCYEVREWNDIRDWADRATELNIPIEWGPGRHGAGNNLFLFIHDPDGNWVELSAELELVKPNTKTGIWKHEPRTLNLWGMAKMRS